MHQMTFNQNFSCDFRLTFGLPLEDVFPDGCVHPSLKRLFDVTYTYFLQENDTIQCLTSKDKSEITSVINALTYNRPLPSVMSFSDLIGTIRQYFKELPVPLIPKYTNKQYFNWLKLSGECRHVIEMRFKNCDDGDLIENLSIELLRLPRVNLLLISYFVNFLRSLVFFGKYKQRYNKRSANILINYFCGPIFTKAKRDESYHPLMLYLIVKWPQIQRKCIELQPYCFQNDNSHICQSLSLNMHTQIEAEILPESFRDQGLCTKNMVMKCNQETCTRKNATYESVQTQTSKKIQLLDEVLQEMSRCYHESKGCQTLTIDSKKTSTVSLLAYTRMSDISCQGSLPSQNSVELKVTSMAESSYYVSGDRPTTRLKPNGDVLRKFENYLETGQTLLDLTIATKPEEEFKNLATRQTLPDLTTATSTEEKEFKTSWEEPLTSQEKQKRSLLKTAKQFPAISLIRQIKDLKICGRARNDELSKGSIKYQKLEHYSTF